MNETEILGLPGANLITERLKRLNGVNCIVADERALFWDDAGEQSVVPLPDWRAVSSNADFALVGGRLVISDIGAQLPLTNRIAEYQLSYGANGLPTSASQVYDQPVSPKGGFPRMLLLPSGALIVANVPSNPNYSSFLSYRSPSGQWTNYSQDHGIPIVPSYELEVALGQDGLIYLFIACDTSHCIAAARWREENGGLKFVDFRQDFLIAGGEIGPDYERPWPKLAMDGNRILLSYQSAQDSKPGCLYRLAHPVITAVDTFPQPPDAEIVSYRFDYQNLYVDFKASPQLEYAIEVSPDLATWSKVETIWKDTMAGDVRSLGCVNPLYRSDTWPLPQCFIRVRPYSYRKSVVEFLPDYVERCFAFVSLHSVNGQLYYHIAPMDSQCQMDKWYLRQNVEGLAVPSFGSESPVDYVPIAWGEGGRMVVKRGDKLFLKWLAGAAEPPPPPPPVVVADFTASRTSGREVLTVKFKNLSQNATSFRWDFGDNMPPSFVRDPVHDFRRAGKFTVTLTADGVICTKPDYISVRRGGKR